MATVELEDAEPFAFEVLNIEVDATSVEVTVVVAVGIVSKRGECGWR